MSRTLTIAAAQMEPVPKAESRRETIARLIALLREAARRQCQLALFDEAARSHIGFCLGYAELSQQDGRTRRFNSSVLVERNGRIAGRYRKIHLPGHSDHRPANPFPNLERRVFEPGDLGFRVNSVFDARVSRPRRSA